jgi:hypothetical protein
LAPDVLRTTLLDQLELARRTHTSVSVVGCS